MMGGFQCCGGVGMSRRGVGYWGICSFVPKGFENTRGKLEAKSFLCVILYQWLARTVGHVRVGMRKRSRGNARHIVCA